MAQKHNESEDTSDNGLSTTFESLNFGAVRSTSVLKIGDETEESPRKSPPRFSQKCHFDNDFKERLKFLTLKNVPPLPCVNDKIIEYFEATYRDDHQLGRRYIHSFTYADRLNVTSKYSGLISGPTFSARHVLLVVKKHYQNEKWLKNSNTMELPLKAKLDPWIVQSFVSKCLDDEMKKLNNFMYFLQIHNRP